MISYIPIEVNGELTWFRIIGQNCYGKTCITYIELNKYDIEVLEDLGLGNSEKEAREVINQWLAEEVYDPQGFWSELTSVTDYNCQIELSDGSFVYVDWEDDKNYAKYLEYMLSLQEY